MYRWDNIITDDGYKAIVNSEQYCFSKAVIKIYIPMKKVKNTFLVGTKYGINTVVELENGEWFQQKHQSFCPDGGGESTWVQLEVDENLQPIILNPLTKNQPVGGGR